jgi:hypothetical protein
MTDESVDERLQRLEARVAELEKRETERARAKEIALYASEEQVAELVLGPGHLRDWKDRAVILEREGLPKIDPMMGGRYLPAVRTFFDLRNGVYSNRSKPVLMKPDGKDNFSCPKPKQKLVPPTRPASTGENAAPENVFPIGSPDVKR